MIPSYTAPSSVQTSYPYFGTSASVPSTGMLFVKDENEALNYPSLRGSMVALFDQREDVKQFYVKTVDMAGNIKPLQIFRYEEITPNVEATASTPVSAEEFNSLKEDLAEMKKLIAALQPQQSYEKKQYRKENRNG